MSIKQQGGVFGRNPTFNDVEVEGNLTVDGEQIPAASNIAKLDTANTFTQRQTVSGTYSIDSVWTGASSAGVGGAFRAVQDDGAAMASGDRIGYLIWGGAYDGANNIGYNAAISGYASENWTAGARGTDVIIQTTDNGTTARNNRLVVRNTGNVEISRNLVISTSGYGIDFSATAGTGTSELLDDYEEGSWTPTFSDSGSGGNTSGTGVYTKIGNKVTVHGTINNIDTTGLTSSNKAHVYGLPFTCVSSQNVIGNVWFGGGVTTSGACSYYIQNSGTYGRFFESPYTGTSNILSVSDFTDDAADILINATYIVA